MKFKIIFKLIKKNWIIETHKSATFTIKTICNNTEYN